MGVGDDVAVIDDRDHVGDREGDQVRSLAENWTEVEDAATGQAVIRFRLGKLVQSHLAVLEHQPGGMAHGVRVAEEGIEIPFFSLV